MTERTADRERTVRGSDGRRLEAVSDSEDVKGDILQYLYNSERDREEEGCYKYLYILTLCSGTTNQISSYNNR